MTNIITNILDTITNGTNIYLQHQIIQTITEKNTVTSWGDPALWGTISIPIILAFWARCSEKNKTNRESKRIKKYEEELRRKEDKDFIQTYIDKNIKSFLPSERKNFTVENYTDTFCDIGHILSNLILVIELTQYKYLSSYIRCLNSFNIKAFNEEDFDKKQRYYIDIHLMVLNITRYMVIYEIEYKKTWESDIRLFESFIDPITLEMDERVVQQLGEVYRSILEKNEV